MFYLLIPPSQSYRLRPQRTSGVV